MTLESTSWAQLAVGVAMSPPRGMRRHALFRSNSISFLGVDLQEVLLANPSFDCVAIG